MEPYSVCQRKRKSERETTKIGNAYSFQCDDDDERAKTVTAVNVVQLKTRYKCRSSEEHVFDAKR